MKSKKQIAILTAIAAVSLVVVGTFAWFNTTERVENVLDLEAFDVTITEAFDPDVPVIPGADLTKDVTIANNGNMDVLVRVKFEEALTLLTMDSNKNKPAVTYTNTAVAAKGQTAVTISDEMIAAYKTSGYDAYATNQPADVTVLRKETKTGTNTVYTYMGYVTDTKQVVNLTLLGNDKSAPTGYTVEYGYHTEKPTPQTITHGKTGEDVKLDNYLGFNFHASVELKFAANVQVDGLALKADTNWYLCNDGYFYYTKKLAGNSLTEGLLSSVSMKQEMANAMQGANYKLTPEMQAVQVNHDAVKATWTDLASGYPISEAAVTANDAKQLVYNIVATGKGYKA